MWSYVCGLMCVGVRGHFAITCFANSLYYVFLLQKAYHLRSTSIALLQAISQYSSKTKRELFLVAW